jgi:hypothetical protein
MPESPRASERVEHTRLRACGAGATCNAMQALRMKNAEITREKERTAAALERHESGVYPAGPFRRCHSAELTQCCACLQNVRARQRRPPSERPGKRRRQSRVTRRPYGSATNCALK